MAYPMLHSSLMAKPRQVCLTKMPAISTTTHCLLGAPRNGMGSVFKKKDGVRRGFIVKQLEGPLGPSLLLHSLWGPRILHPLLEVKGLLRWASLLLDASSCSASGVDAA